jgi:hypothetical protein
LGTIQLISLTCLRLYANVFIVSNWNSFTDAWGTGTYGAAVAVPILGVALGRRTRGRAGLRLAALELCVRFDCGINEIDNLGFRKPGPLRRLHYKQQLTLLNFLRLSGHRNPLLLSFDGTERRPCDAVRVL